MSRGEPADLIAGDVVRYVTSPVFDRVVGTGDLGVVVSVSDGWVRADWPAGQHSVPLASVRKVLDI